MSAGVLGATLGILAACGARSDLGGHSVEPVLDASTDGAPVAQTTPDAGVSLLTANVSMALHPLMLAVDGANVYWTDAYGAVMKCPKSGCGAAPVVLASAQPSPDDIAVDATNVYWVNSQAGVMKCASSGCNDAPTPLTTTNDACGAIRVDSANVYWVTCDNAIATCPIEGCAGSPTIIVPADPNDQGPPLRSLAVDSTGVYWTTAHGTIMTCTPQTCVPVPVAHSVANPIGLAINQVAAVWSTSTGAQGVMWGAGKSGGSSATTVTTFQGGLTGLPAMTVDTNVVYWVAAFQVGNSFTGAVMKCPIAGCNSPAVIASDQFYAVAIAVDATRVYWTNPQDGSIASALK